MSRKQLYYVFFSGRNENVKIGNHSISDFFDALSEIANEITITGSNARVTVARRLLHRVAVTCSEGWEGAGGRRE